MRRRNWTLIGVAALIVLSAIVGRWIDPASLMIFLGPGARSPYAGPPVYNALLSPTAEGRLSQLVGGELTSVRFYIGPPSNSNTVPPANASVSTALLSQSGTVSLTVTLTCTVCDESKVQSRLIAYVSADRRSSVAQFAIRPMPAVEGGGRRGELIFDVTSKGAEYDRVLVPVTVNNVEDAIESVAPPTVATAMHQKTIWPDLRIGFSDNGRFIDEITLQAFHPALQRALNAAGDPPEKLHSFKERQPELTSIESLTADHLQSVGKIIERTATSGADDGSLSPEDGKQLVSGLGSLGSAVFSELFSGPVGDAIRKIEATHIGRPLQIQIEGTPIYIPWALLRASTSGAEDFWGWRYQLVIQPKLTHAGWPSSPPAPRSPSDVNLLAIHGLSNVEGSVGWRASKHEMHIRGLMHSPNQPTVVDSSQDLQATLADQAQNLRLFFTYTHGTNGETIPRTSRRAPELQFQRDGAITPTDLLDFPNRTKRDRDGFFSKGPIAVLTACYSGVGPLTYTGATFGGSFPAALLRLGARGVVAVDAPVGAAFAHHFGNDLAGYILNSKRLPEALWLARNARRNNPSGLLYSYYGTPTAVLGP